jgi:hypothetical protein
MAQKIPIFLPKKKVFCRAPIVCPTFGPFLAVSAQLNQLDHSAAAPFFFFWSFLGSSI